MTTPGDLDERFRAAVTGYTGPAERRDPGRPLREGGSLTGTEALRLFDAQLASRHLDLAARWLRSFGEGYYTIGSSGHEGNAAVAAAVRPSDPALLHYRSGAFYLVRAAQAGAELAEPVRDVLRGLVASAREPIAGGRHKVFGHPDLAVIPTTSTIASHLPRAVGLGFAISRAAELAAAAHAAGPAADDGGSSGVTGHEEGTAGPPGAAEDGPGWLAVAGTDDATAVTSETGDAGGATAESPAAGWSPGSGAGSAADADPAGSGVLQGGPAAPEAAPPGSAVGAWPSDAIVVCTFGDASVNQAAATTALNAAGWYAHSGQPMPVLFVCEDNGLGVSVKSPDGWVADVLRSRPGLRYFSADGCDLAATFRAASEAAAWVRERRRPAVLHLSVVRLMGHAGADAEVAYRSVAEIAKDVQRDPLARSAELLIGAGVTDAEGVVARYDEIGWQVRTLAEEVIAEPKLTTAAEVVAPLAPRRSGQVAALVEEVAASAGAAREAAFGGKLPESGGPLTLAQAINATLTDALASWPQAMVFGEDVGVKGGVYGVTKGLRDRFGPARVFDTLLDETSILGLALGAGTAGLLPVPEIQYLAYLHSAEDQLRGEAATMQFFSQGAYRNPMVVRIAGLAYQEGFGGHFHNDNAVGVLRDVPGLVVACPARPDDAAAMLRTCLAAAVTDGTVSAYLEPIALYHTRDLHADGDRGWLARYPAPADWAAAHVPIGRARVDVVGSGADLTIITFGNGVRMALRAAAVLAAEGVGTRIVDLRWLAPLPVADIIREAAATGRVLIADETRRSGGVGEGILAALVDAGYVGIARRVASIDTFIPLGPAAFHVLVSVDTILAGARGLLER